MTDDQLTDWEVQLLREVAGELPASPWSGAVGMSLEQLAEDGYLTATFGTLTEKGRRYLKEHPHDPENRR